jgi:hypothetical protein
MAIGRDGRRMAGQKLTGTTTSTSSTTATLAGAPKSLGEAMKIRQILWSDEDPDGERDAWGDPTNADANEQGMTVPMISTAPATSSTPTTAAGPTPAAPASPVTSTSTTAPPAGTTTGGGATPIRVPPGTPAGLSVVSNVGGAGLPWERGRR